MSFDDFKNAIQATLLHQTKPLTWKELKRIAKLPYDRPCPEWTRRLEKEAGLERFTLPGRGNTRFWRMVNKRH